MKKPKEPLLLLNLNRSGEKAGNPENPDGQAGSGPAEPADSPRSPEGPNFVSIDKRPWLLGDLLRILLILLSLVVAAGFVLVILPQPTVDKMTRDLQARHGTAQPEKISLLYLGDQTGENEFRITGVVRNIATEPIEKLDAAVRLYAHDGTILQTTIVRMNKETIEPDEVAQFELVYPNYRNDFMKYSVEFKLRDGGLVPYKDMRTTR